MKLSILRNMILLNYNFPSFINVCIIVRNIKYKRRNSNSFFEKRFFVLKCQFWWIMLNAIETLSDEAV